MREVMLHGRRAVREGLVALVDDADYDAAARELFGEFARLNFPGKMY